MSWDSRQMSQKSLMMSDVHDDDDARQDHQVRRLHRDPCVHH